MGLDRSIFLQNLKPGRQMLPLGTYSTKKRRNGLWRQIPAFLYHACKKHITGKSLFTQGFPHLGRHFRPE